MKKIDENTLNMLVEEGGIFKIGNKIIKVAKSAGFCFGVEKAVSAVYDLIKKDEKVSTLGPIIHNTHVVDDLKSYGVDIVETPEEADKNNVLVIRSHGVEKNIYEKAKKLGLKVHDATCPFVSKIHRLVEKYSSADNVILIAGDENHPEVIGIKSYSDCDTYIFNNLEELEEVFEKHSAQIIPKNVILVAQTTFSVVEWDKCVNFVKRLCTNLEKFDTICNATAKRQSEAVNISQNCDVMVVVGGRHSSNTGKLYKVCSQYTQTFLIESADELYSIKLQDLLLRSGCIGITAGASTPADIIKEVLSTMSEILNNNNEEQAKEETNVVEETTDSEDTTAEDTTAEDTTAEEVKAEVVEEKAEAVEEKADEAEEKAEVVVVKEKTFDEMTFEEALEASLQGLSSEDERVKGVVVAIAPNEVHVEVAGRKQAGFIPIEELSFDSNIKPEDIVSIGDEIELLIMRTNDQEGTIMLSKKRVDAAKGWETIMDAEENGTVLDGVITDVIKGGLLAVTNGVRVFIPASQSSLRRMEDLAPMLKQDVKFKIIETDKKRRRAVGSIRQVLMEERKGEEEEFWGNAEVGQEFVGVVKSLTSYGAFVDLGSVDGMIHISELSWQRIKHPSDVISVGDTVEVNIRDLDKEAKRISLGYRKSEENPWNIFKEKYPVGSVTEAKIVGMTDFGAFSQIIPGVDGLIHISQIANRRIEKPQDELQIGETVTVKIINVDYDKHRISLSIRELFEDASEENEEPDEKEDSADSSVVYSTEETAEEEGLISQKEAEIEDALEEGETLDDAVEFFEEKEVDTDEIAEIEGLASQKEAEIEDALEEGETLDDAVEFFEEKETEETE